MGTWERQRAAYPSLDEPLTNWEAWIPAQLTWAVKAAGPSEMSILCSDSHHPGWWSECI